jgi:hypothetical protein
VLGSAVHKLHRFRAGEVKVKCSDLTFMSARLGKQSLDMMHDFLHHVKAQEVTHAVELHSMKHSNLIACIVCRRVQESECC